MGTGGSSSTFDHFEKYGTDRENSPVKWMVYLWNKDGSLNNDVNRPSDKGTQSAILKKKVISNLRFTTTSWDSSIPETSSSLDFTPQLFSSDEPTILKVGNAIYQGNIDTILVPNRADGVYFAYDDTELYTANVLTSFTSTSWWKLFSNDPGSNTKGYGIYKYKSANNEWEWWRDNEYTVGKYYIDLVSKKEAVRLKYKSTAHLLLRNHDTNLFPSNLWNDEKLPILEITQTPIN